MPSASFRAAANRQRQRPLEGRAWEGTLSDDKLSPRGENQYMPGLTEGPGQGSVCDYSSFVCGQWHVSGRVRSLRSSREGTKVPTGVPWLRLHHLPIIPHS